MADVGEEENAGDYHDLFQYLSKQKYPENYSDNQKKTLRRKAKNFKYVDGYLYYYFNKTGLHHKVLLTIDSRNEALAKAHKEADTGRHCGIQKTTSRLLNEFCYYWRGFTRDVKNFVKDCTVCTTNPDNEDKEAAIPSPTSKEELTEEDDAAPAVDLDPSCNSQQTCSESEFSLAPSLQCPECSEHFTSKFSFRIHQRKHADGKNQSELNVNENNPGIEENNTSPKPADENSKTQQIMNTQGPPQPGMGPYLLQEQMPLVRNCISTSETFSTPTEPANSSHPPQPKDFSLQTANKNNDSVPQRGLGSFWAEMIDAIKIKEEKGDEKWWFNHNLKPEVWDMHTGPSSVAFPTSDPMNAHLARGYSNNNCLPVSAADFCQAQLAQDVLRMIPPESPSNQSVIASNSMNNGSSFQLTTVGSNNRLTCECPNCKGNSVTDGGIPNNDLINNTPDNSNNNNNSSINSTSSNVGCNPGANKPPVKMHNCHIPGCTKVFKKTWHLKAHVRTHTGERPFQCQWPSCTKRFTRSDKLHRHMSVHTGERRFSCFVCNKRFVRSDCLTQHLRSHEIVVDNKPVSCSDAIKQEPGGGGGSGELTGDTSVGTSVSATITGGTATVMPAPSLMKFKVYPCPYAGCEKMFKKTWHLKAHVCSHTGEKPFICGWPMCGKRFTRSDKLNRHMNTHTDSKQFPCPLCNKRFVRSDCINHHMRVQHGKSPPSFNFPNNNNTNDDNNNGNSENTVFNHMAGPSQPPAFPHLVNCPPPPPPPIPTQQHQPTTPNENDAGDNKPHPNLMQPNLCEQNKVHCPADHCPANHCPAGCCTAGHCPTAPPGDPGRPLKTYSCSMDGCEKVFKKSWHLKAHVRSHTGEKPFACNWPLCGKRFTRSDKLYRHSLMHTDGKRFPCPLCQKRFVRSDNLNQHVKTHYKQAGRKDKCLKGRRKNLGLTYPPTLVTNPYPSYQANFITSL